MKYKDIVSTPQNNTAWVLQQVANELAEANRLKRLELLRLHLPFQDEKISQWGKELEDQA